MKASKTCCLCLLLTDTLNLHIGGYLVIRDIDDPFSVMDIVELYDLWTTSLPQVKIFYAVKCNCNLIFLKTLAALGDVGFDCATKGEIKLVLSLGVTPDRIIYANPIKQVSHIQYASQVGVESIVFGCEEELLKILRHHQSPKLVLRVSGELTPSTKFATDDYNSTETFKLKFGVSVSRGKTLLRKAKELDADVIGLSNIGIYYFSILDIGGGFPESELSFKEGAPEISKYVTEFSVKYPRAQIIAEPGRYLAASVCTLATCVISKKVAEGGDVQYCLSESTIGGWLTKVAFVSEYREVLRPLVLKDIAANSVTAKARFWGRTCAPDYLGDFETTNLDKGDWMLFENMGSYSLSLASSFHSFSMPAIYYYAREMHRPRLCRLLKCKSPAIV